MRVTSFTSGLIFSVATACDSANTANTNVISRVAPDKVEAVTKNFDLWYRYTYYKVRLSRDFIALDTNGQLLPKKTFLRQLVTRKVLALPLATKHGWPVYQLCVYTGRDITIQETSKQLAEAELSNCARVGQKLPTFKFVDLNGVTYNKKTTHGKIVVIKLWYTSCIACIDEFPQINTLVEKYKQNQSVIFISLAMNEAKTLHSFIKNRQIEFAVVPVSKSYLLDTLKVFQYPTHFIIGQKGNISKITTNADDLAAALDKEVQISQLK